MSKVEINKLKALVDEDLLMNELHHFMQGDLTNLRQEPTGYHFSIMRLKDHDSLRHRNIHSTAKRFFRIYCIDVLLLPELTLNEDLKCIFSDSELETLTYQIVRELRDFHEQSFG